MSISYQAWHDRFQFQAGWTADLRSYLFSKCGLSRSKTVLEIGCGSGVILSEIEEKYHTLLFGLDIDAGFLSFAKSLAPSMIPIQADGHRLPFSQGHFDLTYCHFLLLWTKNPLTVVNEMRRVTRPGGIVLALAEPDYGGRIDYPPELGVVGKWQTAALQDQGADPYIGRRLRSLFAKAGLEQIETGVLGGQWKASDRLPMEESEWSLLQSDLTNHPAFKENEDLYKEIDRKAWESGERILFVPTFYAWGSVPVSVQDRAEI